MKLQLLLWASQQGLTASLLVLKLLSLVARILDHLPLQGLEHHFNYSVRLILDYLPASSNSCWLPALPDMLGILQTLSHCRDLSSSYPIPTQAEKGSPASLLVLVLVSILSRVSEQLLGMGLDVHLLLLLLVIRPPVGPPVGPVGVMPMVVLPVAGR